MVEDDEALTRAFEVALVHRGFVVDVAENGERPLALALAAANPPDVIVLDSKMPVLDGRGFAGMYRCATARLVRLTEIG
ncbi:MAG TPA: response regulator [Gemmatimonadaceae bacterium]|nr:response regulator [Gemmatimonadaceae bacterium]